MTMTLKEMEDAARKRQEGEAAAIKRKNAAMISAETEKRNELETQATVFLAEMTEASSEELEGTISVSGWDAWRCLVTISLPEHTAIQTDLRRDNIGVLKWSNNRSRWRVLNPCGNDKYCRNLGDALAIAACLYDEAVKAEEGEMKREAQREAEHKEQKLDRIERGLHYAGIFKDHPFLKPIFDLLVAYVEDKETLEADLDAAEEFAAGMGEQYARKLNEARQAQAVADDARRRLQEGLWNEQEERRREAGRRKW